MIQAIEQFFLETVGRHLCVFFCAMLPIIELRGAIPLGAGLGLPFYETLGLSLLGNMLPVPFILLFIRQIFKWMKKTKTFRGLITRLENRAMGKSDQIKRYEFLGLLLFVGIPLPGTGAWTGALIASLLEVDIKKSSIAILCGLFMASAIMYIVSYGIVGNVVH